MGKLSFPEAGTPQIQIESWSNAARILQVRGFTRDGTLSHDHTTSSDRSRVSTIFDVSDIPVMMQVSPAVAPVRRGECYVRVTLLMAGFAVGRLIAGYVTDGATLAWPGGGFENFTDGPGLLRSITGTNPAAGAELSETVPTNARWRLILMTATLITDATAPARSVRVTYDDGAATLWRAQDWGSQNASVTTNYYVGEGLTVNTSANEKNLPLPQRVLLFQGYRIGTSVYALAAGDNWGAPQLLVEEWIEE